jgi:tRNA 2-thiouridine synthesizing protein A
MAGEEILDLRGLKCPLPALFARRALERIQPGAVVEIWADDPMAPADIPYMCHREGYEVLEIVREPVFVRLRLKRPNVPVLKFV